MDEKQIADEIYKIMIKSDKIISVLLKEIEGHVIDKALDNYLGSQKRAAKWLGMNRTTLIEKVKATRRRDILSKGEEFILKSL